MVLLRDLRPLAEFAGELAGKLTLSNYFNNNLLIVQQRSPLARELLEIVRATPYNICDNREYCAFVGRPCYTKWCVPVG